MNTGIYRIRNVATEKCYIGSSKNIRSRELEHWRMLKKNIHHSRALQNVYNKYGRNSFVFEILEEVDTANLIAREQHYLDTMKPAYNIRKTAAPQRVNYAHNSDSRLKMSVARKGKSYHTKEQIDKIKQVHRGKNVTKQTRMKRARAVLQLDTVTGNIVAEYYSLQEAYRITGINNIAGVVRGYQKKAGGYYWKYKESSAEDLKMYEEKAANKKANIQQGRIKAAAKKRKPVLQCDKFTGEVIREFASLKEADAHFTKYGRNITNCIAGKQKTAYGFVWKLKQYPIFGKSK